MPQMQVETARFALKQPFVITGHTFTEITPVWVTLERDGHRGRGEAIGVYYTGETTESMVEQLESVRAQVEAGATRERIQTLLPPGGARNALDCAYWDLECKTSGRSIWELLDITPQELTTVATIGIGTAEQMAQQARDYADFSKLKVKLDDERPLDKLRAIRDARPDATVVIDVNQGWNRGQLEAFLPSLTELSVAMVEQPLPRGADAQVEGLGSPIPIGADESILDLAEYRQIGQLYDVINIKLDKCGGLTEALAIAQAATADGKSVMVGNMTGTSLSMAPSYVVGQWCEFVDIDGPVLLASDVNDALDYRTGGVVGLPTSALWG